MLTTKVPILKNGDDIVPPKYLAKNSELHYSYVCKYLMLQHNNLEQEPIDQVDLIL